MTDHSRRMATAARQAVHLRNYRRARDRALTKLSHLYPDTYKQLLGIEKAIDEQEGKSWVDLNGSSSITFSISKSDIGASVTEQAGNKENYDGGEA